MKRKISVRERWAVAFAPSVIIGGVYLLLIVGDSTAKLEAEQKRAVTAARPATASSSTTASTGKKTLDDINRQLAQHERRIDEWKGRLAVLARAGSVGRRPRTHTGDRTNRGDFRHGRNHAARERGRAKGIRVPAALVGTLAPRSDHETGSRKGPAPVALYLQQ